MTDSVPPSRRPTLDGWKEIAAYVGKSIRSAQRAELDDELPVQRIRTATGQIVYAYRDDLDAWLRRPQQVLPVSQDTGGSRQWLRPVLALVLILGGIVAGGLTSRYLRVGGESVEFKLVGRHLEAYDSQGSLLWSYLFDRDVSQPPGVTLQIRKLDLDRDGEDEILVPVRLGLNGFEPRMTDAVYCFTEDGRHKWSVAPDNVLTFGDWTFRPPWEIRAMTVVEQVDQTKVFLGFSHHTWWPGMVVEVAADGRHLLKHVLDGPVLALVNAASDTGPIVVAGGVSRRLSSGAAVFIDPGDPPSTFPAEGDPLYTCPDCPRGTPRRLMVFPATELTRDAELSPHITRLNSLPGGVEIVMREGKGGSTVLLDATLEVAAIHRSGGHWQLHDAIEAAGRLNHSSMACPERSTPRILREWTPGAGWTKSGIVPSDLTAGTR